MVSGSWLSGWKRFWERGGWWRALVFVGVFFGIYQLMAVLVGAVVASSGELGGPGGSPMGLFLGNAVPLVLVSALLVAFAVSIGWLPELFAKQAVRGQRWMWTGVGVVLAINLLSPLELDFTNALAPLVLSSVVTACLVGFTEELVFRGFFVQLMRKAGYPEVAVGLASAWVFAALHLGGLFDGTQVVGVTILQVVHAFFFGLIMYLALRVTGNLIWPMLMHASTDAMLFLHDLYPALNWFSIISSLRTFADIFTGVVLLVAFIDSERWRTNHTRASSVVPRLK